MRNFSMMKHWINPTECRHRTRSPKLLINCSNQNNADDEQLCLEKIGNPLDFEISDSYSVQKYYSYKDNYKLKKVLRLAGIAFAVFVLLFCLYLYSTNKRKLLGISTLSDVNTHNVNHKNLHSTKDNGHNNEIHVTDNNSEEKMRDENVNRHNAAKHKIHKNDDDTLEDISDNEDTWSGYSVAELNVTEPTSKTHEYRLPFIDGQYNDTHFIGTLKNYIKVPTKLTVSGKTGNHTTLNGVYLIMMADENKRKPMLHHGKLIWHKADIGGEYFIYYDHSHHNWVINDRLLFEKMKPIAFLPDGYLFPYRIKNKSSAYNYGVPHNKFWIVRNNRGHKAYIDTNIKVEASDVEEKCSLNSCIDAKLVRVYAAPETNYSDEWEGNDEREATEMDEEETGTNRQLDVDTEQDEADILDENKWNKIEKQHITSNGQIIPVGAKTMQMYITHEAGNVYHTFDHFHSLFNHMDIINDPLSFLTANIHPFVEFTEEIINSIEKKKDNNFNSLK